jgi:type I restriction enzyme M protein
MINGQLKSNIDKLWDDFWAGGIANPLSVIEQISFLMFARLLDIRETREENKASRTNKDFRASKEFHPIFSEKPLQDEARRKALEGLVTTEQDLRWSHFRHLSGEDMLRVVRDGVFPHFKTVAMDGATFGDYMKDAQLLIQKPSLLVVAVNTINNLPLTAGDTKGDLYEYMLGKLNTAGIAGQFRTPRHIITKMVEMIAPRPDEVIGDPACGTAGFLVATMHYLQKKYTSSGMEYTDEDGNLVYPGDKLEPYRDHIQSGLLNGFDFDATMLRIAAMNLLLHNIDSPDIHNKDTLSKSFPEKFPKQAEDCFDVVLANPPFKGSLDFEDVHPSLLKKVKTKKTELLFVTLILKMLKVGGRSATIVPDGVLFGSSKAHQALRKMLVDDNQLEAVISLPSGVFKPYAGVSTAIIVFTKGGRTDNVFFYDVQADGLSLDDKRTQIDANDLPDMLARWQQRDPKKDTDRTRKHFFVPAEDIRDNKYDLSINRYKETVYEEEQYDPPREILDRMIGLEKEIMADMEELQGMLG